MDIREQISEVIYSHEACYTGKNPSCDCGRWGGVVAGTESHADHLADEIQQMLERWLPPLFASAIHAYADVELQAYSYHGDGSAAEAMAGLNNEAAHIAVYALTSTKWKPQQVT